MGSCRTFHVREPNGDYSDDLRVEVEHTNDPPFPTDVAPRTSLQLQYDLGAGFKSPEESLGGEGVIAIGEAHGEMLLKAVEFAAVELRRLWDVEHSRGV